MDFSKKKRKKLNSKESLKYLRLCWEYLNQSRFNGELLSTPTFLLSSSPKYLGAYRLKVDNKGVLINQEILVSDEAFNSPEWLFLDTLLHEMCHQYCVENLGLRKNFHGKIWKNKCLEVGARPETKHHGPVDIDKEVNFVKITLIP